MNRIRYLAADFSGIQSYVLGVKAAGKGQAKRLRARSFQVELLEIAALKGVQDRFAVADDDVLTSGGGGFLVRLPAGVDSARIKAFRSELQRQLWDELGADVGLSLAWGAAPLEARARLEIEKRRPACQALQPETEWSPGRTSLAPLDDVCEVCGKNAGDRRVREEDDEALHCLACLRSQQVGQALAGSEWLRPDARGSIAAFGRSFSLARVRTPDAVRVRRHVPHDTATRQPLTFEAISRQARGDRRLAAIKADVDDMGARVRDLAERDSSLRLLRSFSRQLHRFFADEVQDMLARDWPSIYTVYSGGDDLLAIGPWNIVLDFAAALHGAFQTGPGRDFAPLTLCAGVALTPYRVPIRHGVERAEDLLAIAKSRTGKDRCAALGADWQWGRHTAIVSQGKRLAEQIDAGEAPRTLLHRLLTLLESRDPKDAALREARWTAQVARNLVGSGRDRLRGWALEAPDHWEARPESVSETAVALRYALLATRSEGGIFDG